jgi:hypothetical protein
MKEPGKARSRRADPGITLILSAYRRPCHEIFGFTKLRVDPKAPKIRSSGD